MLTIVLFSPEIPPNTGNIIRLCANTGARLHLVQPIAFRLDDTKLRRAGLDYHEFASIQIHQNWDDCLSVIEGRRIFAITTKGHVSYHSIQFQKDDVLLFGSETKGLPQFVRESSVITERLRIPMLNNSRSLNLSNAVALTLYEAWKQIGFIGA